jgi:magnesium transporter
MKNQNKKIYPPESAGRIMIKNIPLAFLEQEISEVKKMLFEKTKELEALNYIYVIDKEGKLKGVFSIKEIFRKPENVKIKDLMIKEIIKARPHTDQERIAILALRHNLKAIPIVDKENRLLGTVPSDVILDILHRENIEDILRSAGIQKYDYLPSKIFQLPIGILAKIRLPWLIFGLFGGILAVQIINFFENSLKTHFILAAFIPLIVYMADAVGHQTETLFIRSLTLNSGLSSKKYLFQEIKVSFLIALVLAIFLFLISLFWFKLVYLGFILSLSLFLTVICAIFSGILIPWLLKKFKKDPAIGSGPFGTIVRDILSLIIYFSVTSLMLRFF